MPKYFIEDTTLIGIANKIRVLSDTENTMTPDEMKANLDTFNTEITELITAQNSKIAELTEILTNKIKS